MATKYTYNLVTDFTNGLNQLQLANEVSSQLAAFDFISIHSDDVDIIFIQALTTGEKTTLDGIVAAHIPGPDVDPGSEQASVQTRRTTSFGPFGSYTDVTFDSTDFENDSNVIEHDLSNIERIEVKETGSYNINYHGTVDIGSIDARLLKNGSTLITGSECFIDPGSDKNMLSCELVTNLSEFDYITLQIQSTASGILLPDTKVVVTRNVGTKGDKGATGTNGPPGPQGPQGPAGTGSGDVLSSGPSTDNAVARYDLATGTQLQNSGVILDDLNNMTGINDISSNFLDVTNTNTTGSHISFKVADNFTVDNYNLGIDTGLSNRIFASSEEGTYQQATSLLADASDATSTIFGISSSSNNGSSWDPRFIVQQNGLIGIGTISPTEVLDIQGNIAITGTVDGRNISDDGITLDSIDMKNNFTDIVDPSTNDDAVFNYEPGSRWINTVTQNEFICLDNSTGSAVWKVITSEGTIISALNVGSSGEGIFKQANGSNLEFYKIDTGSNKLTTSINTTNGTLELDIDESNILISDLSGYIKVKYDAITSPTSLNDSGEGYVVGSRWIDVVNNKEYVCVDASTSNAIWTETTGAGGGGGGGSGTTSQATQRVSYVLISNPYETIGTTYESVTYFTWTDSRNEDYANGIITFEAEIIDRDLDIRLRDTTNSVTLGTGSSTTSGFFSFPITNPTTNARLELQVKKSSSGGVDPKIYGSVLEYDGASSFIYTDSTTFFQDDVDNTKQMQFQLAGISTGQTRILTIPDGNTTLVGDDFTQTLTNKIIDSITNTVTTDKLRTATTTVDISASAAPSTNHILVANNSTSASWQSILPSRVSNILTSNQVEAINITYEPVTHIIWNNIRNSNYTNGIVLFEAVIGNRDLDIKLRDVTNNVDLGSLINISSTGFYNFNITNPSTDARLELQVKKSANGGTDPVIYGLSVEYDNGLI